MILELALTDQLPSGKNAIKETYINGKKIRYPNKRFKGWRDAAATEIIIQRAKWPTALKMALPLRGDLIMTVSYRELIPVPARGDRDVTGMQDALQHLLEYCEVIENDGQIKSLTWGYPWRIEGPCAIICLTTAYA
jgi:hypothetical protein